MDYLYPTSVKETPTELIVAIDLSGSIGAQINMFITELVAACETSQPDKVRVLWWDHEVEGEQVFEVGQYEQMKDALRPVGGGGTRVGCVSDYITANRYNPDCVLVFTDGYLENGVVWNISAPTLWLVTQNKHWVPPAGKKVFMEN
jgi:predicted metal-dependent peptidase